MQYLVFTDTHGATKLLTEVLNKHNEIKNIIFLGDGINDFNCLDSAGYNLILVKGNCDFFSNCKSEQVLNFKKVTLLLTHGNHYEVKQGYAKLVDYAKKIKANVVLFGHTHKQAYSIINGITLINVGSLKSDKSYGILEITDNHTKINFLSLNGEINENREYRNT